jgi:hypothetical protein
MGVYSKSFLDPVGKTTARVLEQTQVHVGERVDLSMPLRTEVSRAR